MLRKTLLTSLILTATPALAKVKDLRTMTDASGVTEIGFCSRPSPNAYGFPGHAFVTFSSTKLNGHRDFRAVGHTVGADASRPAVIFSYFGGKPVTGKQAEERYSSLKEACLVVRVDRLTYDKGLAAAQPTLTMLGLPADLAASVERYSLESNDCITFAMRVATALKPAGLAVPVRTAVDTPEGWIKKLVTANL